MTASTSPKDEALKLALDALEDPSILNAINNAKFFIRQALAEQEQEPVAIYQYQMRNGLLVDPSKESHDYNIRHCQPSTIRVVYTAQSQPKPQPEQEPVAIPDDVRKVAKAMQKDGYRGPLAWAKTVIDFVADYTAQPQPKPMTVDCIGLALDLEKQSTRVESQTVERAMKAAAHGLRLIEAAHIGAKP